MTGDFRLVDTEPDTGVGGLLEGAHQIHCLVSREHVEMENVKLRSEHGRIS